MRATVRKRKPVEPDWSAINRGFDAKQRAAFNAFFGRLQVLAYDLDEQLHFAGGSSPTNMQEYAAEMSGELHDLLGKIPWMGR